MIGQSWPTLVSLWPLQTIRHSCHLSLRYFCYLCTNSGWWSRFLLGFRTVAGLSTLMVDVCCMQSKAFLKSMKFTITGFCHAATFSITCLSANIWSRHDLPGLKTAYPWRKFVSTAFRILPSSTQANTLPRTDSRVMPRQLLQSDKSPFLGSGTIIPFFHSVETSLLCHTVLNSFVRCGMTVSAALAECDPYLLLCHSWAYWLLVLVLFQLWLPYSLQASVCPVCRFWTHAVHLALDNSVRLQSTCSWHLFICCSCVVACLPSLSLTGGRFTCSPASSLTVWYSDFASSILYLEIKHFLPNIAD